jgi:hypothetical protein
LELLKSLKLRKDSNAHGAVALSREALRSFTTAIEINRLNHAVYSWRARANSYLCKLDDAVSDNETAIRLATEAGDIGTAEKYKSDTFSATDCWEE